MSDGRAGICSRNFQREVKNIEPGAPRLAIRASAKQHSAVERHHGTHQHPPNYVAACRFGPPVTTRAHSTPDQTTGLISLTCYPAFPALS